ncbi:hypothetical protein GALLN_00181 [Gallionellaceae bacterium]|nr:hypothetical protein GALLN_00181 [Gallionellaceae bacterium]
MIALADAQHPHASNATMSRLRAAMTCTLHQLAVRVSSQCHTNGINIQIPQEALSKRNHSVLLQPIMGHEISETAVDPKQIHGNSPLIDRREFQQPEKAFAQYG